MSPLPASELSELSLGFRGAPYGFGEQGSGEGNERLPEQTRGGNCLC